MGLREKMGRTWRVCRFKGELDKNEGGGFFEGEGLIPQCTLRFMFTYTFLAFFSCFSLTKMCFSLFHFFLCDEISNIRNRILPNQKPEQVIRNCQWNCMCNSSAINTRRVSLPPCQLPKIAFGQQIQIQLMGTAGLWYPT